MSEESRGEVVSLERLADALATVQQRCPELAVLAIRWMHLRHPLHPVQGALLRGEGWHAGGREGAATASGVGTLACLRRLAESVCYAAYCWGRLLVLRFQMRPELAALKRRPFDLIVKTWVRDVSQADRDQDFYYGDLQQRLAQRRIRVLMLCGNMGGDDWTAFAKSCARASSPRLAELCLVPLAAPLRMAARQWCAFRRLRRLAAQTGDPLVKRISVLASRDCLAPETARAGLYHWIGRSAVHVWRPRAFMTTYESHSWEQALRWGIRTADPSCCVVGYQHVPLFPEAKSLTTPQRIHGLPVHPDLVLCLGEIPRERLRAGHEPHGTRLVPFGSFWHRPVSVDQPAAPSRRAVLVIPEGHPSAVKELFRFACACAGRLPSHAFILRCHPAFPMTRALREVLVDLPRRLNVVLSEHRALEEDLARSSAVLYRGSSAVMSAILHGVLPIYVHRPGGHDEDPLSGLPAWHARCETPEGLAEVLARHERAPIDQLEAEWRAAAWYLDEYTGPVTEERLETLIEEALHA